MDTWLKSKLLWGGVLVVVVGLTFMWLSRDPNRKLPPADDAFLSYFQAAHGLANVLLLQAPEKPEEKAKQQEYLAKAQEDLEKFQTAAEALPPERLAKLAQENEKVVAEAGKVWGELVKGKARPHSTVSLDWPRLEAAFQLCGKLHRPKK